MSAPRIYYVLALDGVFFKAISRIHPKTGVPVNAILLQSVWAIVILFFWRHFEHVMTSVVFMDIVFMIIATSSILVFRQRKIQYTGYRLPWYPIAPVVYMLIMTAFITFLIIGRPGQAIWGGALLLLGLPVYSWSKARRQQ